MVPAAAGTPQYSGNFIPEIWSGSLLVKYYALSVFPGIANTKYEGEIKEQGDVINIRTTADVVINTHAKGQKLDIQHPDNPMITFPIRKALSFSFICNDIDKHQSDIDLMGDWSRDAGEKMRIAIDELGLGDVYADAHADNVGSTAGKESGSYNMGVSGTPKIISKENILEYTIDYGTILDEQDVPDDSRWTTFPAWMSNLLKKSDIKDVSMTGDSKSSIRHGRLGTIDTLELFKSNKIKKVTDGSYTVYYPMAGHKDAISFAAQMTEMDTLKAQSTFGRIVRGLNVFDYKVLKPEALVTGYVRKGTA